MDDKGFFFHHRIVLSNKEKFIFVYHLSSYLKNHKHNYNERACTHGSYQRTVLFVLLASSSSSSSSHIYHISLCSILHKQYLQQHFSFLYPILYIIPLVPCHGILRCGSETTFSARKTSIDSHQINNSCTSMPLDGPSSPYFYAIVE